MDNNRIPPPWLYTHWKDPARLTHRKVFNLIWTLGNNPLNERSVPSKGLYLHMTTQHRKTWTNIHALTGIRIHDLCLEVIKAYASDRAAIATGKTRGLLN
jgi:hypothetical protein